MSIVRRLPTEQSSNEPLVKQLTEEFRAPAPGAQPPLISVEKQWSDRLHVLVVWDAWEPLPQQERSRIIMDAFQNAEGQERALQVSVAMGLTSVEARRMGLVFEAAEPEPAAV